MFLIKFLVEGELSLVSRPYLATIVAVSIISELPRDRKLCPLARRKQSLNRIQTLLGDATSYGFVTIFFCPSVTHSCWWGDTDCGNLILSKKANTIFALHLVGT